MPIQHAIWQVGAQPLPLTNSRLASEQLLEEMIVRDRRPSSRHSPSSALSGFASRFAYIDPVRAQSGSVWCLALRDTSCYG